jgi:hypothetical protein
MIYAEHPDLRASLGDRKRAYGRPDRILFVVVVVKGLAGFSSLAARTAAWPA